MPTRINYMVIRMTHRYNAVFEITDGWSNNIIDDDPTGDDYRNYYPVYNDIRRMILHPAHPKMTLHPMTTTKAYIMTIPPQ